MKISNRPTSRLLGSVAIAALLGLSLAGCKSTYMKERGELKPQSMSETDWRREVTAAEAGYKAKPKDADAAIRFAEALRRTGQNAQAAAVLQQGAIHNPNHKRLLGAYGRALADNGNFEEAFAMLSKAHTPDQPDWRILNAQGAVLDQMGRHDDARRYYNTALKAAPDESSILSNLGLSHLLSRDLKKAEEILRQANARGNSERRVKQNLALVVGLQGRYEEAERIARADLPPEEAAENSAYLRQMLEEHRANAAPNRRRAAQTAAID
ncbi:bacteriophage N4 receptor, outer membrane subunit [Variibacter gotjawalensis]|uniref:Bacteriophage N4 receptor, outer membrane subunit n=1 Tax=Variibacter gotjawalensis TaxID=1333996 RepID=A0A0S3PPH7_9BRAD|nr:tetratricopeptide repeat protein [Variibacter gotjawalensis]NIK48102.1 Flp pilus assembly protein TadD [Variibacter gotjawalensis]RZS49978.1 Flp pilus assembly protein TadD [Variibacter gotjawalensis]BAT57805.1 bacteriophage N4 receptor, outer membrane subunit [Variibacter gotjawalensis]